MAPPLRLQARGIGKRFGGATALHDVHIDLAPGEIHALCGENGAGKSTLIKILSGIYPHGSFTGELFIDNQPARFAGRRDAARAGIGVIHQELACVDPLSVADNIFLGIEPTRWGFWLDRTRARREAASWLARFGVDIEPSAPMGALGVGQKQLVEIVRALANESRILILDEPTAALAAHETERLLAVLGELRARGVSCLYVSHRLDEVFRIADRITVLRDGSGVGTWPRAEVSTEDIVRHMVGREITSLYPRGTGTRGPVLLSLRGLHVADDQGRERLADISLDLHAGEVVGIGGLMGAGRTELLMHLFGCWGQRTAGTVMLAGQPLVHGGPGERLRAGMALVTEDRRRLGLHLDESIGFNLTLSSLARIARLGWLQRNAETTQTQSWTASLGIRSRDPALAVGRLSGGNQQKVVLAKALMTQPRVVLLDEPTRGVDIGAKADIYAIIDGLRRQGCAILLVSSELPELIGLSDRILMLRQGRIGACFDDPDQAPSEQALMRAAV